MYRNKVAQREAGRVLWLLFCPLSKRRRRHPGGQSNRYSHDIATPLVMGGLGVSGLATPQLHGQGGEARKRASSSVLGSSRRSSQLTNNSLTDSPTPRKASDDASAAGRPTPGAQGSVVSWRSGSIDCRLAEQDSPGQSGRRLLARPRASIAGGCCRPASSALAGDAHRPETRQRSHTFSEARISLPPADPALRPETLAGLTPTNQQERPAAKKSQRPVNSATGAVAVAAAAIAAAELKAMNHPLAYPSLDFFDTGLEDYGRRTSSSFSRFIQSAAQVAQPGHNHASSAVAGSRRRRTCSFSKVLSRGTKQQASANRWHTVFGPAKDPAKKTATSMPSVQHVPSLVTAV